MYINSFANALIGRENVQVHCPFTQTSVHARRAKVVTQSVYEYHLDLLTHTRIIHMRSSTVDNMQKPEQEQ